MPMPQQLVDPEEYFDAKKAAEYLTVDYATLATARHRNSPHYPRPLKVSNSVLYEKRELDRWLLRKRVGPNGVPFELGMFPADLVVEFLEEEIENLPIDDDHKEFIRERVLPRYRDVF